MLPQRNDPRFVIPNPQIKIVAPARLPVLLMQSRRIGISDIHSKRAGAWKGGDINTV